MVENANRREGVMELVVDEFIEYVHESMNNFNLYFNSPNRRKHFKFIMNGLIQGSEADVKELIECQAGAI